MPDSGSHSLSLQSPSRNQNPAATAAGSVIRLGNAQPEGTMMMSVFAGTVRPGPAWASARTGILLLGQRMQHTHWRPNNETEETVATQAVPNMNLAGPKPIRPSSSKPAQARLRHRLGGDGPES
jgi:hypothetical protein